MAFTIAADLLDPGEALYYNTTFRRHLETYLNVLRNVGATQSLIEPKDIYQFEGNFYGYLASLGIRQELMHLYLRVNGFYNPNEFGRDTNDNTQASSDHYLIHPNESLISQIRALWLSSPYA